MLCVLSVLLFTCSCVLGADIQALHVWVNGGNAVRQSGRTDVYANFFAHLSARDQNNDSVGWCVVSKTPGKNIRIVARNPFRVYARIRACRYHDCLRYAPVKMPSGWKMAPCNSVQNFLECNVKFARSDTGEDSNKIEISDCDDEDDDLVSLKKYADSSNPFALLLNTPFVVYCHRTAKAALPFCNHLAFSASDKCIVLRVMRI